MASSLTLSGNNSTNIIATSNTSRYSSNYDATSRNTARAIPLQTALSNDGSITSSGSSMNSTMSYGTGCAPQDSFVAISHTGMSDDEISINSRYLDKPCYGAADPGQSEVLGQRSFEDATKKKETSTQTLPRLTIHTRQTKALLRKEESSQKRPERLHVIASPNTVTKQPDTPMTTTNNWTLDSLGEFPISPNSTPQMNILHNNHSFQSMSSHPSMVSTASSSSKGISSSLDTTFLRERQNAQDNKHLQSAFREFEYWNETLDKITHYWGHQSIHAASTMMELGACLLRCKQYSQALEVYKNAVVIYKRHHGQNSLSVAKGLDRIGFSATLCGSLENLHLAEDSLKEALRIRIHFLGPHHCDCVDTLNNIAGVYLQRKEFKMAKELYTEVLHVRSKIFGIHHASIAITAQMLGKIHFYFKDYENAMLYYDLALRVYRGSKMNLKEHHPLVRKVTKHLAATEKMMLTEKRVQDSCAKTFH